MTYLYTRQGNPGEDYPNPSASQEGVVFERHVCILRFRRNPQRQKQRAAVSSMLRGEGQGLTAQSHDVAFSQSPFQPRVRARCAGRGCISALSLLRGARRSPRQVTCPCHCPASRREGPTAAWQIGWDFTPKLPAKRPHSQVSVFLERCWSDGSDTALTPFNDKFNAKWSGSMRFVELKRQTRALATWHLFLSLYFQNKHYH